VFDNPTFDETQYNLVINGIEVIAQNGGGNASLPLNDITQSINNQSSNHFTTASVVVKGGNASVSSLDSAGSGGVDGTKKFPSVGDGVLVIMGQSGTGFGSGAPGQFAITSSNGGQLLIHPKTANQVYSGYAYADEVQLAEEINTSASAAGAPFAASSTTDALKYVSPSNQSVSAPEAPANIKR
jgi:hypothetical protein